VIAFANDALEERAGVIRETRGDVMAVWQTIAKELPLDGKVPHWNKHQPAVQFGEGITDKSIPSLNNAQFDDTCRKIRPFREAGILC
jgi:hypothetical protein